MSSPLKNRTVLVTGGAGFIGSHIADRLAEDNDVRVLDDLSTGRREHLPDSAVLYEGDVRDDHHLNEAMDGVDVVFHEAAVVSVERSVEQPRRTHDVTVDGTLNVLEAARQRDARVIVASSAAIYGPPDTVPIPESAPKSPRSPYGIDKLAVDHITRRYHDLYGLDTVALRYFNVYGPRQQGGDYSGVIEVFLRQARDGQPLTVHGDGTQTRDFVHVSDVVEANLRAATTDQVGEAYNVATGEETSVTELAQTIREVTASQSEITHTEPRTGDVERSRADVGKAATDLGYEPTVTLGAGIESLVA